MNEKLNLTEIKKLAKSSPSLSSYVLRSRSRVFSLGGRLLSLGGIGFGVSGVVIGLIGLGSITLAAVTQLIILGSAAVGAALVAGGLFAAYQFNQDYKTIKKLDKDLDDELRILKKTLVELIKNYKLLEDEREGLPPAGVAISDVQAKIGEEISKAQAEIENKIKAILSIVSEPNIVDPTYVEKLDHLFAQSTQSKSAIIIDATLIASWNVIRERLGPRVLNELEDKNLVEEKQKLDKSIENIKKSAEVKMNRFEKFGRFVKNYVMPALVGFGSIAGSAMTLVPLIAGVASLTAVGWPVLVPVIVTALVVGAVGAVVYNHFRIRQEKIQGKIKFATAQVSGMSGYLKDNINGTTQTLSRISFLKSEEKRLDKIQSNEEKSKEVDMAGLKLLKSNFSLPRVQNTANIIKIQSVTSQLKHFHHLNFVDLTNQANKLQKQGKIIIRDLKKLREQVDNLSITSDVKFNQQNEKDKLLRDINSEIGKAITGQTTIKENLEALDKYKNSPHLSESAKRWGECLNIDPPGDIGNLPQQYKYHHLDFAGRRAPLKKV